MGDEQMSLVVKAIRKAIDETEIQTRRVLRFGGFTNRTGWVKIDCDNQPSCDWLTAVAPTLKPWPEAGLTAVKERDLPRPEIATVFLPSGESETPEDALKAIYGQNEGLHTHLWRILHVVEKKGGNLVTFSVDKNSAETLRQNKGKVGFRLKIVYFRLKGGMNRTGEVFQAGTTAPGTADGPRVLAHRGPGPSALSQTGRVGGGPSVGMSGTAGRTRTKGAAKYNHKKPSGPKTTEAVKLRDVMPGVAARVADKPESHGGAAIMHLGAGPSTSGGAAAVTSVSAGAPSGRGKQSLSWGEYAKLKAGKGNVRIQALTQGEPSTSGADGGTNPPPKKRWRKNKNKKHICAAPGTGQSALGAAG
jgi:hypothetical protein